MKRNSDIRLRLFPVTIFVAALLLTVKIGDFLDGLDGLHARTPTVAVASLQAQQADDVADAGTEPDATGDAQATAEDGGGTATRLLDSLSEQSLDPEGGFTAAELSVLQDLKARREALDARQTELELREQMLRAAEHTLESKIEEWKLLKSEVEGLLRTYDEEQEADLVRLAAYYERMKPKDAARIFNDLRMDELLAIVQRMKDAKASAIIAEMATGKATSLTSELAARPAVAAPVSTN